MSSIPTYAIACGAILAVGLARYLMSKPSDGLHTFPGPPRSPLIGNAKRFPKDDWLTHFNAWREEYGDVVYIKIPRLPILILSSLEDAEELLVRRANQWSGRRYNTMVDDLLGFGWAVTQTQPSHRGFNEMRKIFRKAIGPQSVSDFDGLMEQEAASFVQRLSDFSGDPLPIIHDSVGSLVVKMTYGEKVCEKHGEALIKLNIEALDLVTSALKELWIVNFFPVARFLPQWVPGLRFPAVVRRGNPMVSRVRNWAFGLVKEENDQGTADLSIVSKYLNEPDVSAEYLRDSGALVYFGAVDTTSTALLSFLCMMLMHPEAQRKIQDELDEIVGHGNAPTSSAVQSMQYLNAAWRESLRLNPPIPTSVPHVSTSDDLWKGRVIPEGTMILCNIGFMLRDPRLWGDDANEFKPERFIAKYNAHAEQLPDISSIPFGFGRRICPGKYLADRNGSIYAATVLSSYNIAPLEGEPILTSVEWTRGQIRRVANLQCRFLPRQ